MLVNDVSGGVDVVVSRCRSAVDGDVFRLFAEGNSRIRRRSGERQDGIEGGKSANGRQSNEQIKGTDRKGAILQRRCREHFRKYEYFTSSSSLWHFIINF